ncbi:MAG: hypothetical protein NTX50_20590 [Candidatus Sumerlaeota bacterium]|nr:hypothetical protein [Candidatus Sumerlaeota bacterium]
MNVRTILLRQVHPAWVQQGQITSQVFKPTPKDNRRLSVYDGDMISPEKAWTHYFEVLHCQSVGVMGVSVGECHIFGLSAAPAPAVFPEHAVIDFSNLSNSQVQKKAEYLRDKAVSRGWLYQAS